MLTDLKESFKGDVPVLIDADGYCWVRYSTIRTLIGNSNSPAKVFSSLEFKEFSRYAELEQQVNLSTEVIQYPNNRGRLDKQCVIAYEAFRVFCVWFYVIKGCNRAFKLLTEESTTYLTLCTNFSSRIKVNKSPNFTYSKRREKDIQQKLAYPQGVFSSQHLPYLSQLEVSCPAGKLDILTSTEVIEVKSAIGWKSALGQVLAYKVFYPDRVARVHLFGGISKPQKEIIEKVCSVYGVKVTYEP